jgi:hypothetical protein
MGKFYLDKRYYSGKPLKWISFESTPNLQETKWDIYGKCVPCITNLYEQLQADKTEIDLGPAYNCWKVIAVMANDDACVQLLTEFEKEFLGERKIKGRFGSADAEKPTRVIVFSAPDEGAKDILFEQVQSCAARINPEAQTFFHRGCAELYHDLFGDWKDWRKSERIRKPEAVKEVIARIRKMLFWGKEGPTKQE